MTNRVSFTEKNITLQNAIDSLKSALDGHETREAIYNLAIHALEEKQQRDIMRCVNCEFSYINSFSEKSGTAVCKFWNNKTNGHMPPVQHDDFCSYYKTKLEAQ